MTQNTHVGRSNWLLKCQNFLQLIMLHF